MQLGAALTTMSSDPGTGWIADRARQLEQLGYDSLWLPQAVGRGFFLPDILKSLAVAAAVTERPTIGAAVLQLPLYEPAELAYQLLSLQHFAGKRLRVGLGAGSTASDFAVYGQAYEQRFDRYGDGVRELRALMSGGEGPGFDLGIPPGLRSGPPLLYGTWGKGVRVAARDYDGWIGSAMHRSDEELERSLSAYRAAGGSTAVVATIRLGGGATEPDHRQRLERFDRMGFDEAIVLFLPGGPDPAVVRGWVV
ncbi:MAG: LLM class flavin-dependent oxidoreductase [Pseudomonadota bacterium]